MTADPDETIKQDADLYDKRAAEYGSDETDLEHAIPQEAEELYRQDLEDVLGPFSKYRSVLEVGAGNGVLTQLLKRWGCGEIVGTDISAGMLAIARKRLPDCRFEHVTSEADAGLFKPRSFDLVISRQLVCHLIDPITVFSIWKEWLKPGGQVAVIDGLWTRRDWGPPSSPAGALVNNRPLSCTQTWATVSYLLRRADLAVSAERFLPRVNTFAREHYAIGEGREPVFRYVVTATAPG